MSFGVVLLHMTEGREKVEKLFSVASVYWKELVKKSLLTSPLLSVLCGCLEADVDERLSAFDALHILQVFFLIFFFSFFFSFSFWG